MKFTNPLHRLLLASGFLLVPCFGGCDYLPEVITGRPDPMAAKLQPAGPSNEIKANATIENAQGDFQNGTGKLVNEATTGYDNPVVQTGGSYGDGNAAPPAISSGVFEPSQAIAMTPDSGSPTAGIPVPAAESMAVSTGSRTSTSSVSANGKIVIKNANLKFVNDLDIASQADGLVLELVADEGDMLSKGALLVQLDDRLANSELAVTHKELEAAKEKAKDDSEILYSRAAFNVAEIDYTKTEELNARGSETDAELRKKWLEKRRAELAITVAELKNNQDKAAVEVAAAKEGAAAVQVDLRKMLVPFDGVVAEKKKEKYDWVRAGEVLLRLVSMEQLRVVGQVRVDDLQAPPHELMNARAIVDIELFPGNRERVEAKIGFVSPVLEVSGAYRVWVQIPNKKVNNQWLFREGMPATIEISTR
jgi:multidrug efflux pump subunit AcrA (membrane-fusion protein)